MQHSSTPHSQYHSSPVIVSANHANTDTTLSPMLNTSHVSQWRVFVVAVQKQISKHIVAWFRDRLQNPVHLLHPHVLISSGGYGGWWCAKCSANAYHRYNGCSIAARALISTATNSANEPTRLTMPSCWEKIECIELLSCLTWSIDNLRHIQYIILSKILDPANKYNWLVFQPTAVEENSHHLCSWNISRRHQSNCSSSSCLDWRLGSLLHGGERRLWGYIGSQPWCTCQYIGNCMW